MEPHRYCTLIPRASAEDVDRLSADIAANGLIEPITVYEGQILDGLSRYAVCCKLGVEPRFTEWAGQGGSPLQFVVSRNLSRRHLTASQKAILAVELKEMLEEEGRERLRKAGGDKKSGKVKKKSPCQRIDKAIAHDSIGQAAKAMDVNRSYVADAAAIARADPELAERVKAGEMTIPEAKKAISPRKLQEVIPTKTIPIPIENVNGIAAVLKEYLSREQLKELKKLL